MTGAISIATRGVGTTGLNPSVGCIIVKDDRIIGRGWTQTGGRPHAEAMAIQTAANADISGATIYVTLEPCAHISERGPCCADLVIAAGPSRVVIAMSDPDPRTSGLGIARLRAAGIDVEVGILADTACEQLAGYLTRITHGRPLVTLKLATSLDGCIAMADGSSRWITGAAARAHSHVVRAGCDAIVVGGATLRTDTPTLNVRLAGLEDRAPRRVVLSRAAAPVGWDAIETPEAISTLNCNHVLVEGGAQTAAAFLHCDLVDRLLLYRAPILLGSGNQCLSDFGLTQLDAAHGKWRLADARQFGQDRMEIYYKH